MQSSHMLNSHVNIVVWWPDSGDFLPFTLLFPPFLSPVFISIALGIRLTSIYMLRCWGDTTSWDIFTSLPLHSFSLSLSFLYLIEPYIVEWVAYFHMLQITRVYRLLSFDVWIVVKL